MIGLRKCSCCRGAVQKGVPSMVGIAGGRLCLPCWGAECYRVNGRWVHLVTGAAT